MKRYTIRYSNGIQITTGISTNKLSKAIKEESRLKKKFGNDNAWLVDNI